MRPAGVLLTKDFTINYFGSVNFDFHKKKVKLKDYTNWLQSKKDKSQNIYFSRLREANFQHLTISICRDPFERKLFLLFSIKMPKTLFPLIKKSFLFSSEKH
jgi:hypothetical protein